MARPSPAPPCFAVHAGIGLREFLENQSLLVRRHARAGVTHGEAQTARTRRKFKHDAAGLGEFHRIAGEVEQDLTQAPVIPFDPEQRTRPHQSDDLQALSCAFGDNSSATSCIVASTSNGAVSISTRPASSRE